MKCPKLLPLRQKQMFKRGRSLAEDVLALAQIPIAFFIRKAYASSPPISYEKECFIHCIPNNSYLLLITRRRGRKG